MGRGENEVKEGQEIAFMAPNARILIVDDNRVSLKMAKGLLRPYQMQVDTSESGRQAVEMVQDGAYDLVFMDHLMPEMNGVETAKAIRGLEGEQYKKLAIVAMSANVDQENLELFQQSGINDFAVKPVERHNLNEILYKWLPKELLVFEQEEISDGQESPEKEDLSDWQMDGIDVEAGMAYSDNDRALYLEVLTDFADNILENVEQIERALEDKDITAYIMVVHSLKSAARYLGAVTVADKAQALEADAKRGDWQAVERETPELLLIYRKLYESIAPYHLDRSYTGKRKRFDKKAVYELLVTLDKYMEEYDIDGGEEIVRALQEYELGKTWSGRRDRIMKAIDQFDYDVCRKEALSWKLALEKET